MVLDVAEEVPVLQVHRLESLHTLLRFQLRLHLGVVVVLSGLVELVNVVRRIIFHHARVSGNTKLLLGISQIPLDDCSLVRNISLLVV